MIWMNDYFPWFCVDATTYSETSKVNKANLYQKKPPEASKGVLQYPEISFHQKGDLNTF